MKNITDKALIEKLKKVYFRNSEITELTDEIREDIEEVVVRFGITKDVIEQQREEIEELKSEQYKDKELARLQADIQTMEERLSCNFGMTKKQKERVDAWIKKHEEEYPDNRHSYSYTFTPMSKDQSICFVSVKCLCGKEHFEL